jgi:hypothetical protein
MAMSTLSCLFLASGLKANGYSGLCFYSVAVGIFAILFITIGGQLIVARSSLVGIFERALLERAGLGRGRVPPAHLERA